VLRFQGIPCEDILGCRLTTSREWGVPTGADDTQRRARTPTYSRKESWKNAKPRDKPCKLAAGVGLHLLIKPGGSSTSWMGESRAESHSSKVIRRLELDVFPWLGSRPIRSITAPELLTCLRRIEARGVIETAHRVHQCCRQILRYAVATGRAERDPSGDLRGALAPVKSKHLASITEPAQVGARLRAMDNYVGTHVARCALRLAARVRATGRAAEWREFDLEVAERRIPAERMKGRVFAHRSTLAPSDRGLSRAAPVDGIGAILVPLGPLARPADVEQHSERGAAQARLLDRRDDRPRLPQHGEHSAERTRLAPRRDRRQVAHSERDEVRASEGTVRIGGCLCACGPEAVQLMAERAVGRGIPPAAYVSILLRTHLRAVAALPDRVLAERFVSGSRKESRHSPPG
jgi:integrase